ncbi:MAG: LemA family protein [Deltaproteobacteria bacterium]|nr:LemA family protein [Deltaproteobacteria bacterium]
MSYIPIVVIAVLIIYVISAYNGLVSKRVRTENAWSQIDVQLKRRYDLIPNLVETVKGYASHERGTLEAVIQARNMAMQSANAGEASRASLENALSGTLKSLFALSESYPDLKANENFKSLQEELSSTENRISFARQHYNDSVGGYVTALQAFPSNIIGNIFGFKPREFFELDADQAKQAKEPPKVSF